MEIFVAMVVVVAGAATFFVSLVPKEFERPYIYLAGGLTVVFGIFSAVLQQHGTERLNFLVERLGTPVDWSTSRVSVTVVEHPARQGVAYQLTVKVVPADHVLINGRKYALSEGHALLEPDYLTEEASQELFWLMGEKGVVNLRKEYESGIFSYTYTGAYSATTELVELRPDLNTYWPNPYSSLRAIEGKYVVAMFVADGVPAASISSAHIKLDSPQGPQLLVFQLPVAEKGIDGGSARVRGRVKYFGGRFRDGSLFAR